MRKQTHIQACLCTCMHAYLHEHPRSQFGYQHGGHGGMHGGGGGVGGSGGMIPVHMKLPIGGAGIEGGFLPPLSGLGSLSSQSPFTKPAATPSLMPGLGGLSAGMIGGISRLTSAVSSGVSAAGGMGSQSSMSDTAGAWSRLYR